MSKHKWKITFPNMPHSKKYWTIFGNWTEYLAQVALYYVHWVDHRKDPYFIEQMDDFVNRSREVRFKRMNPNAETKNLTATEVRVRELDFFTECVSGRKVDPSYPFGNCTTAATQVMDIPIMSKPDPTNRAFPKENTSYGEAWTYDYYNEKQGNNPMRISSEYNTPIASASVINAKSDEAYQREYLLTELSAYDRTWADPKYNKLQELFNINADNRPKSAEELIDKITNGKFKLDEKKMARLKARTDDSDYDDDDCDCDCEYTGGPWYGIIWDGPQPDRKGYDAAVKDYEKAKADTKRKIIVASPADGLQALLDLEAWMPVGKAN